MTAMLFDTAPVDLAGICEIFARQRIQLEALRLMREQNLPRPVRRARQHGIGHRLVGYGAPSRIRAV